MKGGRETCRLLDTTRQASAEALTLDRHRGAQPRGDYVFAGPAQQEGAPANTRRSGSHMGADGFAPDCVARHSFAHAISPATESRRNMA